MIKSMLNVCLLATLGLSSLNALELKKTLQVTDDNLNSYADVFVGSSKMYFKGSTDTYGTELWVSDGSDSGTYMISDFAEGSTSSSHYPMATLSDRLLFRDNSGYLMYTDGAATSTGYIKDVSVDTNETRKVDLYTTSDLYWAELNNELVFARTTVDNLGYELWKTDGNSVHLIKDIYLGTGSSYPSNMKSINNRIVFTANDGVHGTELWSTDGSSDGTVLLLNMSGDSASSSFTYMGSDNDSLYYYTQKYEYVNSASAYVYTYTLLKTDGTVDGTKIVYTSKNTGISVQVKTTPTSFAVTNSGKIYFMASYKVFDNVNETWNSKGTELWVSDGTQGGTNVVADFELGATSSSFEYFRVLGEKILFRNYNDSSYRLWVSDGTLSGTKELMTKDGDSLYSNYYYSNTDQYVSQAVNGKVYFYARLETNDKNGFELYATDGTSNGTYMVKDIYPGSNSSSPQYFYTFDNELYFQATSGDYGLELWKTDGTLSGTQMVHDIWYGTNSYSLNYLGVLNNTLYLAARNLDNYDYNIWSTDGEITFDENRVQDINVTQAVEATKEMCKNDPKSCGIDTVAPALTIEVMNSKSAGWHMLGTSLNMEDMSAFGNVDTAWKWDGTKWLVYSPNPGLQSAIKDAGFSPLNSINAFDGVWIRKK